MWFRKRGGHPPNPTLSLGATRSSATRDRESVKPRAGELSPSIYLQDAQIDVNTFKALGQCQDFLNTHLPDATHVKTSSTASAARSLLTSPRNCAAICSKICATLFDGLEVLREGIQKEAGTYHTIHWSSIPVMTITWTDNFTRFYIVVRNRGVQLPTTPHRAPGNALIRLWVPPAPAPGIYQKDVMQYLAPSGLSVVRIDRRPSDDGLPFRNVYFVETADTTDSSTTEPSPTSKTWTATVEDAVSLIRNMGGEVDLIGMW